MNDPNLYLFFILGALLGSFANLCIYRLPRGISVIKPRSYCTACEKAIPWYHNIPIISVLLLRAKCGSCKQSFSWQTLIVELSMALLAALLYSHFALSFTMFEYLIFAFGLLVISFIDLEFRIIPDIFSLGGICLGLIGAMINPERDIVHAFVGLLLGGGGFWLIGHLYWVLRKEEGMGGGDIKLMAWIGSILSWTSIPFVVLVSSIAGSIIGIIVAIKTKGGMKTSIPYGPFLAAAAVLYLFGGEYFSLSYIRFFMPWLAE